MYASATVLWVVLQATVFAGTQDRRDLSNEHLRILREIEASQKESAQHALDLRERSDRHAAELLKAQGQILPAITKLTEEMSKLNASMVRQADLLGEIIDKLFKTVLAVAGALFGIRQTKYSGMLGDRRTPSRRSGGDS